MMFVLCWEWLSCNTLPSGHPKKYHRFFFSFSFAGLVTLKLLGLSRAPHLHVPLNVRVLLIALKKPFEDETNNLFR